MYTKRFNNNFKFVSVDLGNGSCFDGEWMYMLDDGTAVPSWALVIEDDEDERAARSFGWSEEEINSLKKMSMSN